MDLCTEHEAWGSRVVLMHSELRYICRPVSRTYRDLNIRRANERGLPPVVPASALILVQESQAATAARVRTWRSQHILAVLPVGHIRVDGRNMPASATAAEMSNDPAEPRQCLALLGSRYDREIVFTASAIDRVLAGTCVDWHGLADRMPEAMASRQGSGSAAPPDRVAFERSAVAIIAVPDVHSPFSRADCRRSDERTAALPGCHIAAVRAATASWSSSRQARSPFRPFRTGEFFSRQRWQ
jgi:hypothetical protein